MSEVPVNINVTARDQASGVIDSISRKVEAFRRETLSSGKGGGVAGAAQELEGLAKFGRIAGTVELAAQATKAGIDGISIATAAWAGNWESVTKQVDHFKEEMAQLPFAVGVIFQTSNQLGEFLFGDAKDASGIMAEVDKVTAHIKQMVDAQKTVDQAGTDLRGLTHRFKNELALNNPMLDSFQKQKEQAFQDADAQDREIEAIRHKALLVAFNDDQRSEVNLQFDKATKASSERLSQKIAEIDRQRADTQTTLIDTWEKDYQEQVKATDKMKEEAGRVLDEATKQFEEQRDAAFNFTASPAEKILAEVRKLKEQTPDLAASIDAAAQEKIAALSKDARTKTVAFQLATAQSDAGLTGVQQASREGASPVINLLKKSTDIAANTDKTLGLMLASMQQQGFVFGVVNATP